MTTESRCVPHVAMVLSLWCGTLDRRLLGRAFVTLDRPDLGRLRSINSQLNEYAEARRGLSNKYWTLYVRVILE
jgi:hypothetical protein